MDENVWLTQDEISRLFDVDQSVVTKYLKNIFETHELDEISVCAKFAHTAIDGKQYNLFLNETDLQSKKSRYCIQLGYV